MTTDIRMKDERDEDGTGFVIVEKANGYGHWTSITRHWYTNNTVVEITIHADTVEQIDVLQHTKVEHTWGKKQIKKGLYGTPTLRRFNNFTRFMRKVSKKKCKKDC